MDEKELREAVEWWDKYKNPKAFPPANWTVLIELAKTYLSAISELPERRKEAPYEPQCHLDQGFNSCLDQITPLIVRLKGENEKWKSSCEQQVKWGEELDEKVSQLQSSLAEKDKRIAELEGKIPSIHELAGIIQSRKHEWKKASLVHKLMRQEEYIAQAIHALLTTRRER